jgi:hypothetical protein
LKQYLSKITNSHFHILPMASNKQSEAPQPRSSFLHRLFRQLSTPGPLLSMMRPLFPLPVAGSSPPRIASSPPDREAHPQTSSTFGSLPPLPPAPPHSTPRPISITSSTRDEGKVSALFALLAVTPETHLLMFDGTAVAVPWLISPPRAGGTPHTSSP